MKIINTIDRSGQKRESLLKEIYEFLNGFRLGSLYAVDMAISFGGDRLSCVSDFSVAYLERVIGVASFAKDGEQNDGHPALVGIFVSPLFRDEDCSVEVELVRGVLDIAKKRGIDSVRFSVTTAYEKEILRQLPEALESQLEILDVLKALQSVFLESSIPAIEGDEKI